MDPVVWAVLVVALFVVVITMLMSVFLLFALVSVNAFHLLASKALERRPGVKRW